MLSHKNKAFSLIELSIVILIVGILIAGITSYSSLVDKSRLSSARTLTQSSPVPSIKGLVLWIDSTSKNSFLADETQDSSAITRWHDLNPYFQQKNDLISITSPTYKKNCLNGLPCIQFDGSASYMESSKDIGRSLTSTIFTVFSSTGQQDSYGNIVVTKNHNESDGSLWYYIYDEGPGISLWYEDEDYAGDDISLNTIYVTSFINENSRYTHYTNGTILASESMDPISTSDLSSNANILQIGAWNRNSSTDPEDSGEHLNASVGEIIIFNRALKTEERQAIEKYLGQKWGVKISQ